MGMGDGLMVTAEDTCIIRTCNRKEDTCIDICVLIIRNYWISSGDKLPVFPVSLTNRYLYIPYLYWAS
jgi:hypothetical protein